MRKENRLWIGIGAALAAVGLLIFVGAMIASDFDIYKLSTVQYENNTYEISEDFTKIVIDVDTTEIDFVLSEEKQCRIVCLENEKAKHSASVKDGTLTIGIVDTRKWYDHIGFFIGNPKMTVYLPRTEYTSLFIQGSTGDIKIPKDFIFETIDVSSSTGDVNCYASASEWMKIKLSTGTICVENVSVGALDISTTTGGVNVSTVNCEGKVSVGVSTGKATLNDISCKSVMSTGSTGSILLKNVIATESLSIERSTGSVRFEGSDAAEIDVRTTTGSVKGSLLSEKVFLTETNTGSVDVPKTITGGRCEIKTTTGSIHIEIP